MLTTWRWYLTIKVLRALDALGAPGVAERWAVWSGLRETLELAMAAARRDALEDRS